MKNRLILITLTFLTIGIKAQVIESITDKNSCIEPMYVLDDSIISKDYFTKIDPKNIQELEIVHAEAAIKKIVEDYGDIAKNGAIFIYTKQYVGRRWLKLFSKFCQDQEISEVLMRPDIDYKNFRIFLNGKKLEIDFFKKFKLDEKDIKEVKLSKRLFNEKKYVIKIKTK
jgi:hypothetical protein